MRNRKRLCVAILLAVVALVIGCCTKQCVLESPVFGVLRRVEPGMTEDDVLSLVPMVGVRVKQKGAPTFVSSGTTLVAPEVNCVSQVILNATGLLSPGEYGVVYFDQNCKVVGLRYSSSGGPWRPKWGKRYLGPIAPLDNGEPEEPLPEPDGR